MVSHLDVKKRAPYNLFIGAFRDVTVDTIARGFGAFYEHYNSVLDISSAFEALCLEVDGHLKPDNSRTFWAMTAEEVLEQTFNPDRDPVFFQKTISGIYENGLKSGQFKSISVIEEEIRNQMHNTYIDNRDYYCFKDLYG
ncbi:hypothetical protein [Elizabethkingia anophelis]|uniref:hypothetical protein n=1 Tax=Elizabethkingia anophelis TaxID=1117645 RepID=UPI0012B337E7|nr:hypothetical protein [Elizabethkingia anophelis]QGN22548.1 hypothetical protein GJV56_07855 [Elizabethkingia anophelis]QNV09200.1 hypothetical protein EIY88_07835 [Elizabethkingia anophelis]UTF90956.1 hypothetical protein J2N93_07900 [Elizabethkingia anophelis]UTG01826.1 hypothetical protein J2O04_07905 [Elizabethkingia anophelis]UTG05576.1 hypothetical protein J2O03_07900 [Elizabethkingia anophelis]